MGAGEGEERRVYGDNPTKGYAHVSIMTIVSDDFFGIRKILYYWHVLASLFRAGLSRDKSLTNTTITC